MDKLTALPAPLARPRAGRPTREQAQARHEELLDCALDHFLDKGYEQATIEAIAGQVGMTKRTVYALYPDKAALFAAAVHRAIERYAITEERIAATDCGDLRQRLVTVAPRGADDLGPGPRQTHRDGLPKPGIGAGHKCLMPLKIKRIHSRSSGWTKSMSV